MSGIDGYLGTAFTFENSAGIIQDIPITRGSTIPFTFTFTESDGKTAIDVTGWKVYIAFDPSRSCDDSDPPVVEATLSPTDAVNGIISGEVTDDETFSLTAGTVYASARYIKSDGRAFVFDKAKLKVYPCVNPRRA